MKRTALVLLCWLAVVSLARAETQTLLAWAPGYPGTSEQAQPSMDDFARGVATAAGWDPSELRALYTPKVEDGLLAAENASAVLVTLPAYLEYGEALGLRPVLRVIQQGGGTEVWSLVAHKGALADASGLSGWKIQGLAGFSPRFVQAVLQEWGSLPDDVEIGFTGRVLSVLRLAAKGEPVAALLDRAQSEALDRLPFAADLETITVSSPMISSLICVVGDRLPKDRERSLIEGFLSLDDSKYGGEVLDTIRVLRFERLADDEIAAVDRWWSDAGD